MIVFCVLKTGTILFFFYENPDLHLFCYEVILNFPIFSYFSVGNRARFIESSASYTKLYLDRCFYNLMAINFEYSPFSEPLKMAKLR